MKHYFPKGQPTVRNRASVATTTLSVSFYSKDQLDLFVKDLVKAELYPNFEVETAVGDSLTLDVYTVTVRDISWGHNVTRLAKIIEKYDYNASF